MTADVWLETRRLRKDFGGITAVGDVDLEVARGEVRGVVGPNGAGKSTLVQMLAGIHQPDGGELLVDGEVVRFRGPDDALAAGIALVPQEMLLAPNLTVAENIMLGREPRRWGVVSNAESQRLAAAALARLDHPIDPSAVVADLNPVQRRLVMVARALVGDARLIILDEPTAALAPSEADAILDMVRTLAGRGVSFLYVSHRFDDIEAVADTVTGVRDARLIADLDRAEITRSRLVELVAPVDDLSHPVAGRDRARDGSLAAGAEVVLSVEELVGDPLDGVSLDVRAGEIVGLVGLAGSGVDEVIAMVGCIDAWVSGSVTVKGRALRPGNRHHAVAEGVAYVPGNRTLAALPSHDITSNISISRLDSLGRAGVPDRRRERALAATMADDVALSGDLRRPISSLSGGNQQKAIFARWMAADPAVLLLHDPTAGVDVGARAEIHHRVRELASTGVASLVVTTDLPELVELCDRVLVLDRGRIIDHVPADQLSEAHLISSMALAVDRPKPTPSRDTTKEATHV